MNVTTHERPGVYSVYGASSLVRGSGGRKTVGLAAVNTKAEAGVIQTITSYEEAVSTFGSQADSQDMAELIRVILLNGAAAVAVVPVANAEGYEAAFAAMSGMEDLSVVVCDSTDQEQLTIFRRRNIGFIFQNYNLVPILNVYENIVLPVELDGIPPSDFCISVIFMFPAEYFIAFVSRFCKIRSTIFRSEYM